LLRSHPVKRQAALLAAAAVTVAIAVATMVAPGPAAGRAGGFASRPCAPQGAKVTAEDGAGMVYALGNAVYACSAASGHSTKLGSSGFAGGPGAARVGPVALAGPYVAYGTHTMGIDTGSSQVLLRRLSTGRVIGTWSGFPTVLGPESSTTIEAVVAQPSGSFAWIVSGESIIHSSSFNVGVYEARLRVHGVSVGPLDQGRLIAPKSLKLHGTQLSWRHGSQTRHATLV